MPENTLTTDQQASALLLESVAIPAFAKAAAEFGITADGQEMAGLRQLSDHVATTVNLFTQKRAAAATKTQSSAIKAAIDAAYMIGGVKPPAEVVTTDTTKVAAPFLDMAGIKEAADLLLAARVEAAKKAAESCSTPMPAGEEEEENKGEPVAAAAV